jgi:hypothetical protein
VLDPLTIIDTLSNHTDRWVVGRKTPGTGRLISSGARALAILVSPQPFIARDIKHGPSGLAGNPSGTYSPGESPILLGLMPLGTAVAGRLTSRPKPSNFESKVYRPQF